MKEYSNIYKEELFNNILPFWMKHSRDEECGGYFTCLDRVGNVYDKDKFIWLQGRQVWLFSMLYNNVEHRGEWVDMAEHGAAFLKKYGRDDKGNWYFSLNQQGRPLIQPYNIFSDCFAAMGFGALSKATGKDEYAEIARDTFMNILKRADNTKGRYNKVYPGTRDLKNFALPMILSNLSQEIEYILDKEVVDGLIEKVVHEVLEVFYQKDIGVALENVYEDGSFCDSFEGRVVNPGHNLEAMWFLLDIGVRRNDKALIDRVIEIALDIIEYGWDKEHGGIFYFKDVKGYPLQQLEWDQKLWWVHVEALVCMAKAYQLSGNAKCKEWFERLHEYTWNHFRDEGYGEWWGYLNRQGEVLLQLKGGKWKGCFHVPRGLYQLWQVLGKDVKETYSSFAAK